MVRRSCGAMAVPVGGLLQSLSLSPLVLCSLSPLFFASAFGGGRWFAWPARTLHMPDAVYCLCGVRLGGASCASVGRSGVSGRLLAALSFFAFFAVAACIWARARDLDLSPAVSRGSSSEELS